VLYTELSNAMLCKYRRMSNEELSRHFEEILEFPDRADESERLWLLSKTVEWFRLPNWCAANNTAKRRFIGFMLRYGYALARAGKPMTGDSVMEVLVNSRTASKILLFAPPDDYVSWLLRCLESGAHLPPLPDDTEKILENLLPQEQSGRNVYNWAEAIKKQLLKKVISCVESSEPAPEPPSAWRVLKAQYEKTSTDYYLRRQRINETFDEIIEYFDGYKYKVVKGTLILGLAGSLTGNTSGALIFAGITTGLALLGFVIVVGAGIHLLGWERAKSESLAEMKACSDTLTSSGADSAARSMAIP